MFNSDAKKRVEAEIRDYKYRLQEVANREINAWKQERVNQIESSFFGDIRNKTERKLQLEQTIKILELQAQNYSEDKRVEIVRLTSEIDFKKRELKSLEENLSLHESNNKRQLAAMEAAHKVVVESKDAIIKRQDDYIKVLIAKLPELNLDKVGFTINAK